MVNTGLIIDTVTEWFETLDYEFMILHVMVCYGFYFSKNMEWITKKLGGLDYTVWFSGTFLALIEILRFLPHFSGELLLQKTVTIFHSLLVVQVFVEHVVVTINKWLNVFKRQSEIEKIN